MENARSLFRTCKLRCTQQRAAIYSALCATKSHPTAEELFQMVRPSTPHVSLATVYNTLEALCMAGLARKLPMTDGCCRYDGDMSDHIHMRLTDSGEVVDVPRELGAALMASIPRPLLDRISADLGVHVKGMAVQLSGTRQGQGPGTNRTRRN